MVDPKEQYKEEGGGEQEDRLVKDIPGDPDVPGSREAS